MREYMRDVDAALWFLTETHRDIGPGDSFHRHFSGEPDRRSMPGECWVGLWSAWRLDPLPVTDSARCAAARIPESPLGELVVYGCVLPWSTEWRGVSAAGGLAFETALSTQLGDWTRLRHQFPNASLIVAGDFNQDLAARHYYGSKRKRFLLEAALRDAGLVALTGGPTDPIARDSAPYACIDHICVSESASWSLKSTLRWPDSAVPVRPLSDHFGVMVDVSRS